jgi:UDP-glucose 4-epimerase
LRYLVTGCAGFIGSALTDRLLADGHEVIGYDDFSTGHERFLSQAVSFGNFRLVRGDVLNSKTLGEALRGVEVVFHLAANADVRFGTTHPRKDLEQNTVATHTVLDTMRQNGVRRILFASSGSVYGESTLIPTPEDAPFPLQTSLYGASKLAGEALITAYCEGFGFQSYIFRLVSILGERYTHGHVFDFYRQLRLHPDTLTVLGDGRQRKSYLYVGDCVEAMLTAVARCSERVNIFNLGHDSYCQVDDSIGWICEALGVKPKVEYRGGARGWPGDSPFIFLDITRMRALGWRPTLTIQEGVVKTLRYLETHPDLVDTHR